MVEDQRPPDGTVARHAFHRLRVREVVEETPDTRTFVFDVPHELDDLYRYRPGQFCTVRRTSEDGSVQRCYSMSSAPATDDHLAVTVKLVVGGAMSTWLHDEVTAGDELELMPPAGTFCPDSGDTSPILAFCGGSGITPVFSIIKQVLATTGRRIRLLDANRNHGSIIFREALDELARAHPDRFTLRHHLDDKAGYLRPEDVTDFIGDDTDAHVFICGPAPFMDLVEAGAAAAGVPPKRISIERFTVSEPPPAVADRAPDRGDGDPTRLVVTIRRQRHELDHVPGDTILEATRRAALNAPFSCEQGNCATCMARVTEGSVTMRVNNALTPDEVEEGWVLTCQGLPKAPRVAVVYEDL
jgi:3-ketosteroid 9alpha-monooxygenase subunit B